MKGIIFNELEHMVTGILGLEAWEMLLEQAPLKTQSGGFTLSQDLVQRNIELEEATRLLELDLDARSRDLLEANKKLESLAVRDGLTGLYNHRHFRERCEAEVASSGAARAS